MRLVIGCPVANRAWALPSWFECLRAQTIHPDGFVFVHGASADRTDAELRRGALRMGCRLHIVKGHGSHERGDNGRFRTLAAARNTLLATAALKARADVLLSLDSDVMLEDPRTIERLLRLLDRGYDAAAPNLVLHPDSSAGAWNAGWWGSPQGDANDPRRPWFRRDRDDISWGSIVDIDIPMAAVMMSSRVLQLCRYRWHESGEDLGFAQDLAKMGARVGWDTALKARHVWDEARLRQRSTVVTA